MSAFLSRRISNTSNQTKTLDYGKSNVKFMVNIGKVYITYIFLCTSHFQILNFRFSNDFFLVCMCSFYIICVLDCTYQNYSQRFSGVSNTEQEILCKNSKVTGSCLPVLSRKGSHASHFVNKINCFHR